MVLTAPPRLVVLLSLLGALSACAHSATESTVPAATQATQPQPKPTDTTQKPAEPPQAESADGSDSSVTQAGRQNRLTDRELPIHIKADRIEINQKKSTTLYIGRVSFTQGGLRINAARAEASYKGNKIDIVTASGNPVTLFQKAVPPEQDLHVSALRLEFHALDNQADLYGEVRLQQGTNVMVCNTLHYDLVESTLSAEGGGGGADSRVTVTIESDSLQKPAKPATKPGTNKRSLP